MTDHQIIEETLRYLSDKSYNYAILIDGEWGCGKTFFVKNVLKKQIKEAEEKTSNPRKVKYISLYGCKSIQDIQENIVWGLAEEAKAILANRAANKEHTLDISNNILLISRKIGNLLLEKIDSDKKIYDLATEWLPMKSYIFIFDDIERCDCPLNEVFGFINGLVEHEGTKVILVANEKEISMKEEISQKELQYAVVLSENIKWPPGETLYTHYRTDDTSNKVSPELLEERRKMIFADVEVDSLYQKIREKLIGVTLHYKPDVKEIAQKIIENSDMDVSLKKELIAHMNIFNLFMDANRHHNLRTFQFFVSKICYLYQKFIEIEIEEEYQEGALSFLIQDCFRWAVRFKGNIPVPADRWGKAYYEAEKKSAIIKAYVEMGEYNEDLFKEDIKKYVDNELKNKLPEDDPFILLYHQCYFHNQQWCEQKLEEIKQKLENNKYPVHIYSKLIVLVVSLVEIGFSDVYLSDIKERMSKNISMSTISSQINDDLSYIEDNERRQKALSIINQLNLEIVAKDKQMKQKTIVEILSDENWVDELGKYLESDFYIRSADHSVFSKSSASNWIQAIKKASVEDIDIFRKWLQKMYPDNGIGASARMDLPVIKEIAEGIKPEEEKDLIKKINLKGIKEKMEIIISNNS